MSGQASIGVGETPPQPHINLVYPPEVTSEMLEGIRVDPDGGQLVAQSRLGEVAVEIWVDGERRPVFSAIDQTLEPDTKDTPPLALQDPYAILRDGEYYQVVLRVPASAVSDEWGKPERVDIEAELDRRQGKSPTKIALSKPGIFLPTFERSFPDVDVSNVDPEGRYRITAERRLKPTIGMALRLDDGEPAVREMRMVFDRVVYDEVLSVGHVASPLRPDTAYTELSHRGTRRTDPDSETGKTVDLQRLIFEEIRGSAAQHAGHKSGALEVILHSLYEAEFSDFRFQDIRGTAYSEPLVRSDTLDSSYSMFDWTNPPERELPAEQGSSSLTVGKTTFGKVHSVEARTVSIIPRPPLVAAFRVALVGSTDSL